MARHKDAMEWFACCGYRRKSYDGKQIKVRRLLIGWYAVMLMHDVLSEKKEN